MTDKMLSAEKVNGLIDAFIKDRERIPEKPTYADAVRDGYVVGVLNAIRDAVNSGEFDADCPKCGGSGTTHINRVGGIHEYWPCDCPAGTGGSEK